MITATNFGLCCKLGGEVDVYSSGSITKSYRSNQLANYISDFDSTREVISELIERKIAYVEGSMPKPC